MRKLVSSFYDRVLDEDELAAFFENTDMAKLIDHQTKFWAMLLGGPVSYTEDQLRKIHTGMKIEDRHFELIVELVGETLEDHDVDEGAVADVTAKLRAYHSVIVVSEHADG